MRITLNTVAALAVLATTTFAAVAQTTTPEKVAPPMAGAGDMMGMMGGAGRQMGDTQMGAMLDQMQQMMQMMQMMQTTRMMNTCEKMMSAMSMMDKGGASKMENQTAPAPKG